MRTPGTSPAEFDRADSNGIGWVRLALPFVVVLLLVGAVLWRGNFEGAFQVEGAIRLRAGLSSDEKMTAYVDGRDLPKAFRMYAELTGRELIPSHARWSHWLDRRLNGRLVRWGLVKPAPFPDNGICYHRDGRFSAIEVKQELEELFQSVGLYPVAEGREYYRLVRRSLAANAGD
jgi:hypothetical protein